MTKESSSPKVIPQAHVPQVVEVSQKNIKYQDDIELQKKYSPDNIRLDFQNICYDVKTPTGIKRILNNVSGYVCPGEILYIMGPSGGGKTSLLDFLCNRTKTDPSQYLYMNDQKWNEKNFKKLARYCQQYPLLYEVLTVQETLEFAARFATENDKQTQERVDNAISLLGLQHQRDTKVGGLLFRGISGGQKKRVSIGEELVANPKLLFLDEPTSGLDSASAYQLMENLRQICRKTGITVIASIHQPSQRVFDISDRLMILAGGKGFGGNVAYFGKTSEIDQYFQQSGIINDSNASTSEWILDQVNGDFGEADKIQRILDYYKQSENCKQLEQRGEELKQKQNQEFVFKGEYTKQPFIKDILTLLHRGYKNNIKNPLALAMRVIVYCAMAVVIGTVWWQVGDSPDAGDIMDMNGALYFAAAFFMFMTISVLPTNIEDRQIMVKEKTNGAYALSAYSISSFLVATPMTFLVSLFPGLIVHFMLGFPGEDSPMFILNLFVCVMAAEGLMLIISTIFDHLLICIVLVSQFLGSFMIMNGFFIKKSNIPDGWIWLHYSAFNTYTFQNFVKLVYKDLTIKKNLDIVPPALQDFPGEAVLKDLDVQDADEFSNIIYVILFMLAFRFIAYLYSRYKHTGKK